ncbi:unnamed protein product, partial [Ectocarpus sp. 8 AP-2014]
AVRWPCLLERDHLLQAGGQAALPRQHTAAANRRRPSFARGSLTEGSMIRLRLLPPTPIEAAAASRDASRNNIAKTPVKQAAHVFFW